MRTRHVSYMLYMIYNSFSALGGTPARASLGSPPRPLGDCCWGFPDPESMPVGQTGPRDGPPQRSIWPPPLASSRGGTSANFGREAPGPGAHFGRHAAARYD